MKKIIALATTTIFLAACNNQTQNTSTHAASSPVASAATAANHSSGSLIERINNKGVITVGTEGTYAPYSYHDANGQLTGYDVEVTRAVAAKLGVQVEFKETQWDGMMAG